MGPVKILSFNDNFALNLVPQTSTAALQQAGRCTFIYQTPLGHLQHSWLDGTDSGNTFDKVPGLY